MREIFLILVIANIVFFAYQVFMVGDADVAMASSSSAQGVDSNLRLLAEQHGAARKKKEGVSGGSVHKNSGLEGAGKENELCTMVGPYGQLLHAEYLVERLAALGIKSQITPVEIKEGDAYWVYLPPEMSEKEALRRLYELQKKNIESYIVTKGELANGISFGRYAERAEAESRLSEVKGHGYDAAIKIIPKTINETWVVLGAESAEKISENVWLELLNSHENIEKRQNYCLGVASQ